LHELITCNPFTLDYITDLELLQQSESLVGRAKVVNVKQAGAMGKKSARNKNKSTAHYLDDAAAPYLPLPAGTINIKRMVNANIAEPSKQKITGVFWCCLAVVFRRTVTKPWGHLQPLIACPQLN
jgi:hypothetical protein